MTSQYKGSKVGFPIRRSLDQSSFAAPQGISQRTTSFIASQRQGIHQMLLRHLITLMIDVRALGRGQTRYKRKTCLRISPKTIFACQAYSALPAAGRGWFAGLGARWPNMLPLYDFKHPRPHPRGEARTSMTPDTFTRSKGDLGGACRDRTDDLKLAKLPLSQLS